jgi:hypothetical protein
MIGNDSTRRLRKTYSMRTTPGEVYASRTRVRDGRAGPAFVATGIAKVQIRGSGASAAEP